MSCGSDSDAVEEDVTSEVVDENTNGNDTGTGSEQGGENPKNPDPEPNPDPVVVSPANSVVDTYGLLQTSGNKIVGKDNTPVQLRGMSLFWSQWEGEFYTKEAVSWLKNDWKCTIVRAAMGVEDNGGFISNPEREKQKVFTVIDAAIDQGIYVIVDWHSHHAEDHQAKAIEFFAEVAKKYGSAPNIIYEIYNEPLQAPNWKTVLKPYHEAVIAEIRKHDSDNLIICGTRTWSQDVDEVIGNEINDVNVAYTLHYYAATHTQFLRDKAQKALDAGLPLFVTEYGTTAADGNGGIDANESRIWWDFMDKNKISSCNWSIADKNEASAALTPGASGNGGWSEGQITTSGKMVRDEIIAKNADFK